MKKFNLPPIPDSERTPLINMLLKIIEQQQEAIEELTSKVSILEAEVKRLKKHPKRPRIKPSKMDKNKDGNKSGGDGKRKGSAKRNKNATLKIHKTERVKAENVPDGAEFKGYDYFTVQDIEIKTVNTRYELERWRLSDGSYMVASLPEYLRHSHFGPTMQTYILYQYHHCQVTQPLLWSQLKEWGVDISSGQLNRILTEDRSEFHEEKDDILIAGLSVSGHINVDDTGARHKGKNGFCTHIGNELFGWFCSTESKSRINFLQLLRANHKGYRVNKEALNYMKEQRLAKTRRRLLQNSTGFFEDKAAWEVHLDSLGISNLRHRRIATEGALIGSIVSHGFNLDLVIISDDAGQFNVFSHALCWIHAERKINELVPLNTNHAAAIDGVRRFFWQFYDDLKDYKLNPSEAEKKKIEKWFDDLFSMKTCYETLNQVLKRLKKNKSELLLVLNRPDIPLHNNLSESDIRDYVKRRKVSGSTRSESGRLARDTFASLKKTCKKLNVRFWDYIQDRVTGQNQIPPLPELIRKSVACA